MNSRNDSRPLSLVAIMRLLKAAEIPEYSPEAVELIKLALRIQLPPVVAAPAEVLHPDSETEAAIPRIVNSAMEVFGRMIREHRRAAGLSLTDAANHAALNPVDLVRMENGTMMPPKGSALLRLIEALDIPVNSHDAVEIVLAAGLPHLDRQLVMQMSENL